MITLFGSPLSPFVRKVQMALFIKGLEFKPENVVPGQLPEGYLDIHPLGKIPAIRDGAYTLPDSSAILAYLERKYPEPALFPADAEGYGTVTWYEEYCDTRLMEATGGLYFQRFIGPMLMKKATDPAVVEVLLNEKLPAAFAYLEKTLKGAEPVFSSITAADLSLIANLVNLRHVNYAIDSEKFPKLAAYDAWMTSLPFVARELQIEAKILGRG